MKILSLFTHLHVVPNPLDFVHIRNPNEDLLMKSKTFLSLHCHTQLPHWIIDASKRDHKANPYEHFQIFWRDSIALYNEHFWLRLLITFNHWSTNVNISSRESVWRAKTNLIGFCVSSKVLRNTRMNLTEVLIRLTNMLELPFTTTDVWVDECLNVNKSLNSICSPYKVIVSLQKLN